ALLLALRDLRSGAGASKKCRNAGAARPNTLGERSLGVELDLQFARKILLREGLVLPDVGRDHLFDLLGVEQKPEAHPVDAALVGNDGQVLNACVADR